MTTRIANPDSPMVQQMEGHWHQLIALVLWKLARGQVVRITPADLAAFDDEYKGTTCHVFTNGLGDAIELSLVNAERAQELAAYDRQRRGHA